MRTWKKLLCFLLSIVCLETGATQEQSKDSLSGVLNYVVDSFILKKHPKDISGVGNPSSILQSRTYSIEPWLQYIGFVRYVKEQWGSQSDFERYKDSLGYLLNKDSITRLIKLSESIEISASFAPRTNLLLSNYFSSDLIVQKRLDDLFCKVSLSTPLFLQNGKYCIIMVQYSRGMSGVGGSILLLRKGKENWTLEKFLHGYIV